MMHSTRVDTLSESTAPPGVLIVLMIDPAAAGSSEPSSTPVVMMAAAARGDAEAFGELYDFVAPAVWGLVRDLREDEEGAERLLHEIFLDAWRSAPAIADAGIEPQQWLCEQARLRHALGA